MQGTANQPASGSSGVRRRRVWPHRLGLLAYLALVVVITCVHDLRVLSAALAITVLLCGRDLPQIAPRVGLAVLWFTGVVSLSYAGAGLWRDEFSWTVLARLNLRVLVLTTLALLLPRRIDLFRALAFSATFQHLLLLAYGQIMTFRRIVHDFGLALKSRSLARPRWRDHYRHRAAMATFFIEKSLRDAQEITMAMTARGFFLDRD